MIRLAALLALSAFGAAKGLVTVVDAATGEAVAGLTASDFGVTENRVARRVETAETADGPLDVLLLIDASTVHAGLKPAATSIVEQMGGEDRIALAAFDETVKLVRDFTADKTEVLRDIDQASAASDPRLLDGIGAALALPFPGRASRKAIVVITAGIEGLNRNSVQDVVRLARRHRVSVYTVFVHGSTRGMFETIARQTGGAAFLLRDHKPESGARIVNALRGAYLLRISGAAAPGEQLRVNVKGREKTFVSALPLESR